MQHLRSALLVSSRVHDQMPSTARWRRQASMLSKVDRPGLECDESGLDPHW